MPEIRVLPDDLVNQIAAGEVIERPASIVKELVENSLDAAAGRIDVAIEQGGSRRIEVVDDGCGMSREDAVRSFERHATSKIGSLRDLERIGTLGFRGEALPSIASVAAVRMRTALGEPTATVGSPRAGAFGGPNAGAANGPNAGRPARDHGGIGTELVGEGRGIATVRDVACPPGTRIEVVDLFERVPARRAFLKTAVTEAGHVVRWLERMALGRPDVRFSLARDGRESLLFLPTADLRERVLAVLPGRIGARMLPVEGELAGARVVGYTTPTDVMRGSTGDIHVFVNGRPVRDRLLLHLVRDAYRDALPPGRHPACVLYLHIEPEQVDVNVHPAKWEVRFRDPGAVRQLLGSALRRAIGARERLSGGYASAWRPADPVRERPGGADRGLLGEGDPTLHWGPAALRGPDASRDAADPMGTGDPAARPPVRFSSLRYLGQALETYLILEGPAGLILLDQHAAHERVLFERMRRSLLEDKLERQALLIPVTVELERSAADALDAHAEELGRAGFEVEVGEGGVRGGVRVRLRTLPALLPTHGAAGWAALLEETAAGLRDGEARGVVDGLEGALHHALATAACHTACRKGDRLDPQRVSALLAALDEELWVPNCPHGRPIWLHLELGELERRFLRR